MHPTRTWIGAFLFLLLIASGPAAEAATEAPEGVVSDFQSALLSVMKTADSTTIGQRYERLAPRVDANFAIEAMMHIILGERWRETGKEDRARLVAAFRRMSITTLATLFDGYSGETFAVVNTREGRQKTRIVETHLERPDDSPIDIAYVTLRFKDGWRIIDVIVDKGISELTVRRSEYRRLLKEGGVSALAGALNAKADSLIAEK